MPPRIKASKSGYEKAHRNALADPLLKMSEEEINQVIEDNVNNIEEAKTMFKRLTKLLVVALRGRKP